MIASDIISKALVILSDTGEVRWSTAELLDWMSEAQVAIGNARPNSVATFSTELLTADSSKQTLPSGGFQLIEVIRNMGSDGITPGSRVRRVDLVSLRTFSSDLHSATGETVVKNYAYDPEESHVHYWVAPRTHATTPVYLDLMYAKTPVALTSDSDTLTVRDDYENPILDFTLYRAFSKDTEHANISRAVAHYNAFAQAVGLKKMSSGELNRG